MKYFKHPVLIADSRRWLRNNGCYARIPEAVSVLFKDARTHGETFKEVWLDADSSVGAEAVRLLIEDPVLVETVFVYGSRAAETTEQLQKSGFSVSLVPSSDHITMEHSGPVSHAPR